MVFAYRADRCQLGKRGVGRHLRPFDDAQESGPGLGGIGSHKLRNLQGEQRGEQSK